MRGQLRIRAGDNPRRHGPPEVATPQIEPNFRTTTRQNPGPGSLQASPRRTEASVVDDAPSVLILDDGELERLQWVLEQLGADFERCTGPEIPSEVPPPRDLLITSGRRAMKMPRVAAPPEGVAAPFWICVYDMDFRSLRERLRALGVHFLIHGDVDADAVRLFLLQLLHRGAERRRCRRIPLQCEVELAVDADHREAQLVEISRETCRFVTDLDIPSGANVTLRLPASLTGGIAYDLAARRVRAAPAAASGEPAHSVVVAFVDLEPEAGAQLDRLLAGEQSGTRVTPLAEEPLMAFDERALGVVEPDAAVDATPALWDPLRDGERRGHPRHPYERRVEALRWTDDEGPRVALGKDLSLSGVRVVTSSGPRVGAHVTLALYGGPREEPIIVEAEVIRVSGAESSLRFVGLRESERRQLEKLAGNRPILEALRADPAERLVIARVLS